MGGQGGWRFWNLERACGARYVCAVQQQLQCNCELRLQCSTGSLPISSHRLLPFMQVCCNYWHCLGEYDTTASELCRYLGFTWGRAVGNAMFGRGAGPVWMDNFVCTGEEGRPEDCEHPPFYSAHCGHEYDVGLICDPPPGEPAGSV